MSGSELHIPYDAVENHIQCSICLSVIRGAILTPCGHRYCNRCITEWVGRNHTCPCCNSTLNSSQFYFDVQFDALVEGVLLERDKAEEAYVNSLFQQNAVSQDFKESNNRSPFEEILKKHMKSSLMSYKQYFNRLQDEFQRKTNLLDKDLSAGDIGNTQETTGCHESQKEALQKELEKSKNLAAQALDKYLSENIPTLEILPVTISIYLTDKDIRLENVVVRPSDSLTAIRPAIEEAMLAKCDKIISWNEEGGVLLLFGPLSKSSIYNITNVTNSLLQLRDVHLMSWDTRPILQCNMCPGSEIVLNKVFTAESDMPQRCFANIFQKADPQPVDYFLCNQCNVKWICKSCIQCCHRGHDIVPFVLKHTPTWACCYCPKKKVCIIQNN